MTDDEGLAAMKHLVPGATADWLQDNPAAKSGDQIVR